MSTAEEIVDLIRAQNWKNGGLSDLIDVRDGLKDGGANWLELVALEGSREGGTHHGASYVPEAIWTEIIDFTEGLILRELSRLGVQPPPQENMT